jgi:hypothetical protein
MRRLIVVIVAIGLCVSAPWCWAGLDEGVNAYRQGDYATALRELLPLAQQGDPGAQSFLGFMYTEGRGVPQIDAEAVKWYRRAADQGRALAQFNLGAMYLLGRGVPKNSTKAAKWIRRAADRGYAGAQHVLGFMYYLGAGIPQDFVQAHLWLNLFAANLPPGEERDKAVGARDTVAQQMSPAQLTQAQELARQWQPKPETPGASPAAFPVSPRAISPAGPVSSFPRRDLVRQVQERLQAMGFNPGTLDGTLGPQTQQALRGFQHTKGVLPTGDLDEHTLHALGVRESRSRWGVRRGLTGQ